MEKKLLVYVLCVQILTSEGIGVISIQLILQFFFCTAHFHPFDPYAPHDPNNGYPQHFCDLNDDEFGRPYLGPFDQHVDSSARNPFPKIPPPDNNKPTAATGATLEEPTRRISHYQNLHPMIKDHFGEENVGPHSGKKREAKSHEFMKRQSSPLPGCTALNECSAPPRKSAFCTLLSNVECHFLQRNARDLVRSTIRVKGGARASVGA